eukprot:489923-Rhodomonas_salina.1
MSKPTRQINRQLLTQSTAPVKRCAVQLNGPVCVSPADSGAVKPAGRDWLPSCPALRLSRPGPGRPGTVQLDCRGQPASEAPA